MNNNKTKFPLIKFLLISWCILLFTGCNLDELVNEEDLDTTPAVDEKSDSKEENTSATSEDDEIFTLTITEERSEAGETLDEPKMIAVLTASLDKEVDEEAITVKISPPPELNQLQTHGAAIILPPIIGEGIDEYNELMPHPELYCAQPTDESYEKTVDQLGGYKKAVNIHIEQDAATPKLLDGIEPAYYEMFAEAAADNAVAEKRDSSVSIQRPNTLARQGNRAFYLSDIYGLISLNFSDSGIESVKVSCSLPLPGIPKNFVIAEDSLIVIVQSLDLQNSAILQFSLAQDTRLDGASLNPPIYQSSLFFENQTILDARLFNQTLALYVEKYKDVDEIEKTRDKVSASDAIAYPIFQYREIENYQLKVVSTVDSELVLKHTEVFVPDNEEILDEDSTDRWSSSFNHFLSASGEYLVVTESKNHRYISHYEKRNAYRCTKHETRETPYHYCSTNWKKVENPDYEPPKASGVFSCDGDLLSCLTVQLPKVNRYIHVPDGETCHSGTYKRQYCVTGHYEEYEVPVYENDSFTQFHVFRFIDDKFQKFDDQLANLEESDIKITDKPFRLSGRVQKHDHLRFHGKQFYAITSNDGASELHSLSIIGNSAILTDSQTLRAGRYSGEINANYTESKIYISDSRYAYGQSHDQSEMQTFSLFNPLVPVSVGTIKIPTKLEQLFFSDDLLIGIGSTYFGDSQNRNYIGSVTNFDANGQEISSVVLGADYRHYNSGANYDDQIANYDISLNRLFIPYQGTSPVSTLGDPPQVKRLSIIEVDETSVSEEKTFSLPATPERTLSINADLAFSFEDEYIHHLNREGEWQAELIFDGEIPDSIYYSRAYPTQVQKTVRPDSLVFKLIDSDEGASGTELDSVSVSRTSTNICTHEQVYFDQDRFLVVQDKPGTYLSYQDCPEKWVEREVLVQGYKIEESTLSIIEDKDELTKLYHLIRWDMHCVIDIANRDGKFIEELPKSVDEVKCFTREQYQEMRWKEDELALMQR